MSRVVVLVFLLTLSAAAQRNASKKQTDPSGTAMSRLQRMSSLQVRVITDNERPVAESMRVQVLRTDSTTVVAESMTMEGMAQFPALDPGHYIIRVTGSTIEDTTTPDFEVVEIATTTVQFVHVKLRSLAGPAGGARQATVSAQELTIPRKAREEFNKAGEAMQHADWKQAAERLNKAVSIYPQYAAAYNNLGVVAMQQNDVPKAKASFQKAVDLNDPTGSAYLNLGRLSFRERDFGETARLMGKSLALDANNPEALTILADCDAATGHFSDAITHARLVHTMPHDRFAVAHVIAAAAFEKEHDLKGAAAEYEQFLKEDPNSPRAAAVREALQRLSEASQAAVPAPRP